LSRKFREVYGIDIRLTCLLVCKKLLTENKIDNVHLLCADAERLPLSDNYLDYAQSKNVIEHISDRVALITEAHRCLRENGIFLLSSPNRYFLGRESHSKMFWVGFLPRSLMRRHFADVYLLSYNELRDLMARMFDKVHIFSVPPGYFRPIVSSFLKRLYFRFTSVKTLESIIPKALNSFPLIYFARSHTAIAIKPPSHKKPITFI